MGGLFLMNLALAVLSETYNAENLKEVQQAQEKAQEELAAKAELTTSASNPNALLLTRDASLLERKPTMDMQTLQEEMGRVSVLRSADASPAGTPTPTPTPAPRL